MLRRYYLELLLILSAVLLIGQLAWPTVTRWWWRPLPGSIGIDQFDSVGVELNQEFLVYLPPGYGSGAWPLVVYLHGAGERGTDPNELRSWGPFAAVQNGLHIPGIVIGPQCRPDSGWSPDSIMQLVEHAASRYNVNRDRIYVVGFSMGAYGTWQTAASNPDVFAAIVPICGGGSLENAKALAKVPTWAFHGDKDNVVPLVESQSMVEAMLAAGGQPKMTVIPEAGHGIVNDVCCRLELWNWLFQQRRDQRQSLQQGTEPSVTPDS